MYRAVAWKAHQTGLALDDEAALAALAEQADLQQEAGLITIDGADVTRAIRTPEMDHSAARVARLPAVGRCSWHASGPWATGAAW